MSDKVPETTLISAYQADGSVPFPSVQKWLDALYSEASLKKFDEESLIHIISLKNLEENIGYTFKNRKHLLTALMQSTFCYEMKDMIWSSNERLEFLGDSLLNFIVAENLYHLYPTLHEGDLSKFRGALVNEEMLAKLARAINLGENIFLGKGEYKSGGYDKDSILADAFESLIAAIYFDSHQNIEEVKKIFGKVIETLNQGEALEFYSEKHLDYFDSKSKLQEFTMAKYGLHPIYKSHDGKNGGFVVELWLGDKRVAEMDGTSKKKIEKLLAKKVLEEKLI